jgi:hypothetical protein
VYHCRCNLWQKDNLHPDDCKSCCCCRGRCLGQLQLQPLPAVTYLDFGGQLYDGDRKTAVPLPEALTTMTSLRVGDSRSTPGYGYSRQHVLMSTYASGSGHGMTWRRLAMSLLQC